MDQAVDGGCGCHGVFEDALPLAEGQVARQQDAASFIALGEEREQDFHFISVVLDVADVVDDERVVACQAFEEPLEAQVLFGPQELLDQQAAGREIHAPAALNQFMADGTQQVGLATAGVAEGQDVLAPVHEVALDQRAPAGPPCGPSV